VAVTAAFFFAAFNAAFFLFQSRNERKESGVARGTPKASG
jgi:hypothetical protein